MFIEFDGIKNVRELGGTALADGRKIKMGKLLRGAHLNAASDGDIARLQEMGLRYIVDFRDGFESGRSPDRPVPGAENRPLQALPPFRDGERRERDAAAFPDFDATFARIYTELAQSEEARLAYRGFFRTLLDAEGGAVLWHCTQGKDRTGVAAILLLTALGADWEDIRRDYFLSNEGLEHMLHEPMPEHMRRWPEEVRRKLILVYPHLLELFLEKVRERWGSLEGYLGEGLGLDKAQLELLREYYTE